MSLTVFVHGETRPTPEGDPTAPSITFDMPRVVVGRGDGCEVRLPDRSVSSRHLTLRQRGSEWLVVDEGSTNGTRLGRVVLSAHAPRVLGPSEVVRVGKIWLRIVQGHEPATKAASTRARSIALSMAARQLEEDGERGRPFARVAAGASAGTELTVGEGTTVLGRSREADWVIEDAAASRRHAELELRGDTVVVRDLGSKSGTTLGEAALGSSWTPWKPGTELAIGETRLAIELPAIEALAEMERMPDQKVPLSELEVGAPTIVAPEDPVDDEVSAEDATAPEPEEESAVEDAPRLPERAPRPGSWGLTDLAVVVLALGVMSLSAVGYFVLLR
jgi:pSer/pThr/pTyr-binding forkhead associated (FHA) protein